MPAETIGERMRSARVQVGLRQRQVAARVSLDSARMSAYERDRVEPRAQRLVAIAHAIGCDPVWLITGEGEPWP